MPGLLDKLNVLVRSGLNTFLDDAGNKLSPSGKIPAERLGNDIDGEIAALRKKIDEALTVEDAMQQRLDDDARQIDAYDKQADGALQRGDEASARSAVEQMQRLQRQTALLQADLEQHRRSTSEFIERVNTLDAIVSDARREQQNRPRQEVQDVPLATDTGNEAAQSTAAPGEVLSNVLREARQRVENAISAQPDDVHHIPINIAGSSAPPADRVPDVPSPAIKINVGKPSPDAPKAAPKADDAKVDEDLARRRSRLSKPD